ncbi:hypothetical protein GCK32_001401 [Trichostrongylus colubriformis]|uniref:Uncharacterized protein n=1 Tax=Trichostrongylus colubriformis TaxID=6319 RepID=A0AAN8F8N5_TRICO
MLLIVAVLVVFLGNTYSANNKQQTDIEQLMPEYNSTFAKMNGNYSYKLIWDEKIVPDALQEAKEQYSTNATFKIRRRKVFIKGDNATMEEKVEGALKYPVLRADRFIWDEKIVPDALKEAKEQYSTNATFKIRRRKVFIKGDNATMEEKVEGALKYPVLRADRFLRRLLWFTHYACNGFYDTKGGHNVLTVACLYREIDYTKSKY